MWLYTKKLHQMSSKVNKGQQRSPKVIKHDQSYQRLILLVGAYCIYKCDQMVKLQPKVTKGH